MGPASEDVAASPGGESAISSKRGASPEVNSVGAAPGDAARKKKKTGPGSRGVANLTPEQLAKKRENGMSFTPTPCIFHLPPIPSVPLLSLA